MIPIVKREPPDVTEALLNAVRTRMMFTVPSIDVSGWYSAHKHTFLVQCNGVVVALYDKKADHWFISKDAYSLEGRWAVELVKLAVSEFTETDTKFLRQVQKNGFASVVRKRLNVAKEK